MGKKIIALLLSFVMIMSLGISASAIGLESPMPAPGSSEESGIMPLSGTFSIYFNLGINYYTAYSGTFSLDGTEKLGYSASWSPTTQYIALGVRNTSTSEIYYITLSGGNATGTFRLSSKNVPAGQYQVVVVNPSDSSYTVNGNVNLEWK